MARKPRIEFAGAIYHVLNRGNYRADMFEEPRTATAFVDCLFEACEKSGWLLHAYTVMRNHYHLVVETPRGNLVSGVHWLQSTFGNRFNRFRREHGRAFQGRYQAILVEPGIHLLRLVDYVHLNPVRAGIKSLAKLEQFHASSYRHFVGGPKGRPAPLRCESWLKELGGLADTPAGWRSYHDHLVWLTADPTRQKEAAFDQMCQGWAIGSESFRSDLAQDFKQMIAARDWGGAELAELNRIEWGDQLKSGLRVLRRSLTDASDVSKSAPWKIALAAWMKSQCSVSNRWLAEQLDMGPPDAVSRYVGELSRGERNEAAALLERITTKVRG
jgi:REP element-mobilizing transposase RayT